MPGVFVASSVDGTRGFRAPWVLHGVRQITLGLLRPAAQLSQPLRSVRDHLYPLLQFLLQFRDFHLVRDAVSVADALHIAVLNQLLQTPNYGYAGQLQSVRDLMRGQANT